MGTESIPKLKHQETWDLQWTKREKNLSWGSKLLENNYGITRRRVPSSHLYFKNEEHVFILFLSHLLRCAWGELQTDKNHWSSQAQSAPESLLRICWEAFSAKIWLVTDSSHPCICLHRQSQMHSTSMLPMLHFLHDPVIARNSCPKRRKPVWAWQTMPSDRQNVISRWRN